MIRFVLAAATLALGLHSGLCFSEAKCEIARVVELPITMMSLQPTIMAKINGKDARFVLDSGAFYSMISSATAAQYELQNNTSRYGLKVSGVGGAQDAGVTTVKEFTLANVPIKNLQFIVGGSEIGPNTVGLLGQNLLEIFDVEYDLGHGAVRLFKTNHCSHSLLAYWLKSGDAYSVMEIEPSTRVRPWTIGVAYLNGQKIRIAFDSGAENSLLSKQAAARAGIKLDSEGVQFAGYVRGVGRGSIKSYTARFSSFKVGDGEEVKNARLRISDNDFGFTDMLLGADFFVSHRIFVSNKEQKLFLSYSGGPVFDLTKHHESPQASEGEDIADAGNPAEAVTAADATSSAASSDAAEVARQGSALIARGDFAAGLPLLSKAITINPKEPEYYYQRGNAYWADKRADLALADFDEVIKLNEAFLPAYIPRAELQLAKENSTAALVDLETVDRLAPKQADLRYSLALVYERIDHMPEAIQQYSLWIDNHPDDSRMVAALGSRCFSRAMQNQDLPDAMKDCDKALSRGDKSNPAYSNLWVDRALVRIRMGEYDKAIADCNDAVKKAPKNATALYVRAVVEARKNKKAESEADLSAARQIAPKAGHRLEKYGFTT